MATATKKRPAKSAAKPERKNQFNPAQFDKDEPDQERQEVDSSLSSLQGERDKLADKLKSVDGWRDKFRSAQAKVAKANADFEVADAARKKAKAAIDAAIARELELVAKFTSGEQLLPFDQVDQPEQSGAVQGALPVGSDHAAAESIEALLTKNIKKTLGSDTFEGEKVGITDSVIEKLNGADIRTIGDLEKRMRGEDGKFLNQIPGIKDAAVDKISLTLLAYRSVYPVPSEPESIATIEAGEGEAKSTIRRGDGSVVEGGVDQMVEEINEMFSEKSGA